MAPTVTQQSCDLREEWWARQDSNLRPPACEAEIKLRMILPRFPGLGFNEVRGQYRTLLADTGGSGFDRYIFTYIRVARASLA